MLWDNKAVEFDTKESAIRFLESHLNAINMSFEEYCKDFGVFIKEDILYYDDGYTNLTNKIIFYAENDTEGKLIDVNN